MLSLLCTSPRSSDALDSENPTDVKRRRSLPLGVSRSPKRRIVKGSIGSPEAFRHEVHVGPNTNLLTNRRPEVWDIDQWRSQIEERMQEIIPTAIPQTPLLRLRGPRSPSPSTPAPVSAVRAPVPTPPRRKPVPAALPETSTVSPFPTVVLPNSSILPATSKPAKELVPLLDGKDEAASTPPGEKVYVTKTTKARWDGAMEEIAQALKEDK